MKRMLWTLALTFLAVFGSGAWYSHHQASVARADRWSLHLEEDAADARLDKLVRLDGRQVTLAQLGDLVAAETGLEVTIDEDAILRVYGEYIRGRRAPLHDPGTLTYQLPIGRFTLRDTLDRLLNPSYLAYEIRGSSLVFTTQDAIADHLQTVTYSLPAMEQTTEDDWVNLITLCTRFMPGTKSAGAVISNRLRVRSSWSNRRRSIANCGQRWRSCPSWNLHRNRSNPAGCSRHAIPPVAARCWPGSIKR